jgi:hypothetical protein
MKKFVVAKGTEDAMGIEILDGRDSILLINIDEMGDTCYAEFIIPKSDISKLIEGLKLFCKGGIS